MMPIATATMMPIATATMMPIATASIVASVPVLLLASTASRCALLPMVATILIGASLPRRLALLLISICLTLLSCDNVLNRRTARTAALPTLLAGMVLLLTLLVDNIGIYAISIAARPASYEPLRDNGSIVLEAVLSEWFGMRMARDVEQLRAALNANWALLAALAGSIFGGHYGLHRREPWAVGTPGVGMIPKASTRPLASAIPALAPDATPTSGTSYGASSSGSASGRKRSSRIPA